MESGIPFIAYPIFETEKHPFQIDMEGVPNPRGAYEVEKWEQVGFTVRMDMPGVPQDGLKILKRQDRMTLTFTGTAPEKENFPLDESERVYAGFVQVYPHPYLTIRLVKVGRNGCFLLGFPKNDGSLFFLPAPKSLRPQITIGSVKSDKGEGSSSGKSIDKSQGIPDQIDLGAMDLAGSAEARQGECSTSGRSSPPKTSRRSRKGSAKTKQGESSSGKSQSAKTSSHKSKKGSAKTKQGEGSSGKPIHKTKGSATSELVDIVCPTAAEGSGEFEQGEGSSAKPIDIAEGSGEAGSNKISSYDADDAWMLAWIKKNVYQFAVPKQTEEEAVLAETSPTEQSTHEAPEVAIGSIEECDIHTPHCQCQCCDLYGVYLKTWSTTEDIIMGNINYLKIKGPDRACEKRVVQKDGQYSLYVRADLPGLEPHLCVTAVRDRCILVYGRSQSEKNYLTGGRSYLFFLKLRCSCCKFDTPSQNHEDGVLRMFCKIIRLEPGHSISSQ